ncbi:MAG: DUF2520 domain-containing protein [bacterium]|nr:DUF2520 domain-containing protein [bacterium]
MNPPLSLAVIGIGKVGETLARLLHKGGCRIAALSTRTVERSVQLAAMFDARVTVPRDAVRLADLTLLTVPDDVLEPMAAHLADGVDLTGKSVIHVSGAHDLSVLKPAAEAGASVGGLHPAFPFADVETAVRTLGGAVYALEASSDALRSQLRLLVSALDGTAVEIPPGKKALYHAALTFASNYTVTLYALAERLLIDCGTSSETAAAALTPLLAGTLDNLKAKGIPAALTGPLVRGDAGTLKAHLQALETVEPDAALLYRMLAHETLPLAQARGTPLDEIRRLLE